MEEGKGIRIIITILSGRGMKLRSSKGNMATDFYRLGWR